MNACGYCNAVNGPADRYCRHCGATRAAGPSPPATAVASPPQAIPLYELPNFRSAAAQWRSRVITTRNKARPELESIARAAAARNPAAAAALPPHLASRIALEVPFHPIDPPSADITDAARRRYRELEGKYQERLRRRLRDQARRPPA